MNLGLNRNRYTELDSLRGIAAIIVVLYHFTVSDNFLNKIFKYGTSGVDLFFIISGFVILMTIEKSKSWKQFVISRFSRLYPAYWVCVSITTIMIVISVYFGFHSNRDAGLFNTYLANLTMFQHYLGFPNIDGQYWTLIVELNFYIFILILYLVRGIPSIHIISSFLLAILLVWTFFFETFKQYSFHSQLLHIFPLLRYFPLFFAGMLFYDVKKNKATFLNIILIISCFMVCVLMYSKFHRHIKVMNTTEYLISISIYFSFFCLFILNRLKLIVGSITLFLGEISYSLYLIHEFIGYKLIIPALVKYIHLPFFIALVLAIAIVILIAYLINILFERPALIFIRERFKNYEKKSVIIK